MTPILAQWIRSHYLHGSHCETEAHSHTATTEGSQVCSLKSGSEVVGPQTPRKGLPVVGTKARQAEGLTCKVKAVAAGICWHSEGPSCRSGVSSSSEGAGRGGVGAGMGTGSGAGAGVGVAEGSLLWHSFNFTTKSQHV